MLTGQCKRQPAVSVSSGAWGLCWGCWGCWGCWVLMGWLNLAAAGGWCGGIDLDFSERVGIGDLAIFAGEWMLTVP